MTRYSIQTKDRIFVKGYRFLSFAKNIGKKIDKNVSKSCFKKSNSKNSRSNW